jgi:ferric-dicitrate binding protein FerR (iron transport regulator)
VIVLDPLIHRFLEDPGSLGEPELDQLVALLRAEPRKAIELREQLLLDDHLSQKLAIDRQNFFAQIEQRIADFEQGEEEMYDHVAELRAIAEAEIDKPLRQPPRPAWLKYSLAAAISLALVAGLIAWQVAGPGPKSVASIEDLSGEVTIVRGSQQIAPQLGKTVFTGDQVVSTVGSTIEWKYKDGTTVRLVGDAVSIVAADAGSGAKQVRLDQGELVASVARQERGPMVFSTPHATATVRGTELRLVVGQANTQLDVTEGQVDLTRLADGQTIQVAGNETGVASAERIALKLPAWPVDRSQAVYLFQGNPNNVLCRNPQSGNFRESELTSQGEVSGDGNKLVLAGGFCTAADDGADITMLVARSGEFTCEVAFLPLADEGGAGGVVLSLGPQAAPNLQLRQQGARLVARASSGDGDAVELTFGEIVAGQRVHLVLSGRNGALVAYVSGVQTADKSDILIDTSKWLSGPLSLGADAGGENAWHGQIERLAIFAHHMNAQEARRERERFELVHPK